VSSFPAALSEDWIPDQLLVRSNKLEEMRRLLENPASRSVYVFGPKGVGKSLTCKFLLISYPSSEALYVPCLGGLDESVRHALLLKGARVKEGSIFDYLARNFSLMVIDDLSNLYNYRKSLYFLQSLYTFNMNRRLAVVLVGTWSFEKFKREICPPEVFSRYYFTPVGFGVYSMEELVTILKQRVERAFEGYEDGALNFIAAKTLRLGGDTRLALRILQSCWLQSKQLTPETAEKGWYVEKKRYWRDDVILSLDGHTALLFWLIASKVDRNNKVTSSELYNAYARMCKTMGVEPLYVERLNYCLRKLERLGYIIRNVISLGKYGGRQSEITLLFDEPTIIEEAGKGIDWKTVLF